MPAGLLYLPANAPKYAGVRSPLWFVLGATAETTPAVLAQFRVVFTAGCGAGQTVILDLGDVVITMTCAVSPNSSGNQFAVALNAFGAGNAFLAGCLANYTLTQRYNITVPNTGEVQFVARTAGVGGNATVTGTATMSAVVDYAGANAVLLPNYSVGLRIWDAIGQSSLVAELSGEPKDGEVEWDLSTILGAEQFLKPDMPDYLNSAPVPLLHQKSTHTFWLQWWQRYGDPVTNQQAVPQYSPTAPLFAVLAGHDRNDPVRYDIFIGEATGTTYPKPFLTYRQRYGKRITSATEQHYLAFHTAEAVGDEDQIFMQARIYYTDPGGANPVTTSWSTRYADGAALYPGYASSWPTGYGALDLGALLPTGKVMHWYEVRLFWTATSAAISEVLRFHLEAADYNEQHVLFWSSLGAPETMRCTGAWSVEREGANTERYSLLTRVHRTDTAKGANLTTPGSSQRTLKVNVISASLKEHQALLDVANSPQLQYVDHAKERHLPLRLLSHKATEEQRGTDGEHLYLLEFEFLLDDPAETVTLAP